jgi:uncharacterized membrane protein
MPLAEAGEGRQAHRMQLLVALFIALWMLAGGTLHLIVPEAFFPIVPSWLPRLWVVYLSGVIEIAVGIGVILPATRSLAGLAFAGLCALFLPLHLWDFFRPDPIFSVPYVASFRIGVQLGLIALGLWLWRRATRRHCEGAQVG